MDPFKQRLKQDARDIEARPPAELAARVMREVNSKAASGRPWLQWPRLQTMLWPLAVTGLAGIVLLLGVDGTDPEPEDFATTPTMISADGALGSLGDVVLRARHADFDLGTGDITAPLNEELEAIQADIEKAAAKAREDLQFMF